MTSVVRQVLAQVTLGGTIVPCEECSVGQSKKGDSGTFHAKIPLIVLDGLGMGLDWLSSQTDVTVSVKFVIGGNAGPVMFTGTLDKADVAFGMNGQIVTLSGRDASSKLKDTKTNEKFINQKSEEIAKTLAGRCGLTLETDGGTGMQGRIYTAEQAKVTGNQSLWQLLRHLGENEGKVHFVVGDKLHFKKLDDASLPLYYVKYIPSSANSPASSNAVSITIGRNFQAAKKHTVNVKSWDHKKKQLVTATASSGSGTPEMIYEYQHHHKTQDQATRHAKAKLAEHTRHEFDVTIEMPGDYNLTPLYQIVLNGTGSSFDQNYNIDHIDHKISARDGYKMTITTKAAKKGRS